jgi:hypothetical protein
MLEQIDHSNFQSPTTNFQNKVYLISSGAIDPIKLQHNDSLMADQRFIGYHCSSVSACFANETWSLRGRGRNTSNKTPARRGLRATRFE